MSYNSKYTGAEVEALLDAANGKQDKIEDLDEIRSGAAAGATALQSVPSEYVTETELTNKGYATISALEDKVDKVSGKQLTTEDFTTVLKNKLEGLSNYDDTKLSEALSTLRGDFDKLVSGDTTTAIKTFNEVIAFLDGVQDTQDLSGIIASIEQQIAGKQDTISDLNTLREKAEEGATIYRMVQEDKLVTPERMVGTIEDFIAQFENDVVEPIAIAVEGKVDSSSLATVATSGSYNDLSNKPTIPSEQVNADWNATSGKAQILNKPTIPSAVTESTVSGWGFTKNTGTYSKPSGGIPKTDLASAVQTSLGKADTALQSYTEQYKGTVTGVKINGSTKNPSSGVVDLGTVITSHQDISGKQDKLVSGTNIKSINGESILGAGDIEISGGSGGGEDIRYFTEFTVEDFIKACESNNVITYDTTELFNAMKSNKVICVPYRGFDKGFVVASYTSGEDEEYPSMYLQKGDVEYCAWTGDDHELVGDLPIYNNVQVVEMEGGEVVCEILDNRIYKITDPVDFLFVAPNDIQKGATIQFMSGESGTTLEVGLAFWANGEIPQIEPNTYYELSIMLNSFYEYCVVLTPFKQVE